MRVHPIASIVVSIWPFHVFAPRRGNCRGRLLNFTLVVIWASCLPFLGFGLEYGCWGLLRGRQNS
jgi:hypothetical protein